MNSLQLQSLGLERAEAQTWPRTYSMVGLESFFAQQTCNRSSATWKKAEYIAVKGCLSLGDLGQFIDAWRDLGWNGQFLIVDVEGENRLYDGRGQCLVSDTAAKVQDFIRSQL